MTEAFLLSSTLSTIFSEAPLSAKGLVVFVVGAATDILFEVEVIEEAGFEGAAATVLLLNLPFFLALASRAFLFFSALMAFLLL